MDADGIIERRRIGSFWLDAQFRGCGLGDVARAALVFDNLRPAAYDRNDSRRHGVCSRRADLAFHERTAVDGSHTTSLSRPGKHSVNVRNALGLSGIFAIPDY